jgi:hypothetical protein
MLEQFLQTFGLILSPALFAFAADFTQGLHVSTFN